MRIYKSKLDSIKQEDWDNFSNKELSKITGLKPSSILQYRKRKNLPFGPKDIKKSPVRLIDYEYTYSYKNSKKFGSRYWKKAVYRYYGSSCGFCGYLKEKVINHCHHRIELCNGGKNTIRNGIVLCARCHAETHAGLIILPSFKISETYIDELKKTKSRCLISSRRKNRDERS